MNLLVCFLFHLKNKILTKQIVLEWRASKDNCPVMVTGKITNRNIRSNLGIVCVYVCVCVCVCSVVFDSL